MYHDLGSLILIRIIPKERTPRQSFIDSSPETVFRILFQWNLDYGFQSLVGFRIPQGAVYSGIQCPGFRIPPVKIPPFPESGFLYMGREIAKLHLRSFLIKRIIFKLGKFT